MAPVWNRPHWLVDVLYAADSCIIEWLTQVRDARTVSIPSIFSVLPSAEVSLSLKVSSSDYLYCFSFICLSFVDQVTWGVFFNCQTDSGLTNTFKNDVFKQKKQTTFFLWIKTSVWGLINEQYVFFFIANKFDKKGVIFSLNQVSEKNILYLPRELR